MSVKAGDLLESRHGVAAVAAGIVLLFAAIRAALFFGRDPFFDELFTQWLIARPWGEIVAALRHDSGPPLYYVVARPLGMLGATVPVLRLLSLAAAAVALGVILCWRELGAARFTAAALLAVHPAAALFAIDARAYALCGVLVLAGVALIEKDRPFFAALGLTAAAYSHYYGALFLPALLLRGRRGAGALAAAMLLFAPGIYLAWHQPAQSIAWAGAGHPAEPLGALLFLNRTPSALFAQQEIWPVIIAGIVLAATLTARQRRFAAYVAIPVVLAVGLAALGRSVYFPMRFESVLAAPLALWIATSLHAQRRGVRVAVVTLVCAASLVVLVRGVIEHLERPLDRYRRAAQLVHALARPGEPVVASGYCYLEVAVQMPSVRAFPAEQAVHPGWRADASAGQLRRELDALPAAFLWTGERASTELAMLRAERRMVPLAQSGDALVARFEPRQE